MPRRNIKQGRGWEEGLATDAPGSLQKEVPSVLELEDVREQQLPSTRERSKEAREQGACTGLSQHLCAVPERQQAGQ